MNTKIWLYHPEKAPDGRLFSSSAEEVKELEADGWLDTPAKFGMGKSAAGGAGKTGGGSSGEKSGSKKDPSAGKKPKDGKSGGDGKKPNKGDDGKGDDPKDDLDGLTDDELRAELEGAEVKVPANASRDQLLSGVRALRGDE